MPVSIGGGKRVMSSVSICIVLVMAVCQTSGGPSAPVVWGLVLFPGGARRADRAVVEVEAPDSDDIVGEGELWAKVLGGVAGALGGVLLSMLGGAVLVRACAYVAPPYLC